MRLRKDSKRYQINEWRICATLVCNLQTNPHLNGTTDRKWWNKHARQHHKLWFNENCVPFIPFLFDCHSTRWFSAFVLSARRVNFLKFRLVKIFRKKILKNRCKKRLGCNCRRMIASKKNNKWNTTLTWRRPVCEFTPDQHQNGHETMNGRGGGGQATTKTRRTFSEWMNEMDRFCFWMGIFTARRTKKTYKTRKTS